jgi:hypothetical protein
MEDTINILWSGFTGRETRLGRVGTMCALYQVVIATVQHCVERECIVMKQSVVKVNIWQNRYIEVEVVKGEFETRLYCP